MNNSSFIFFLIVITQIVLHAQPEFINYTESDGLVNNNVNDIVIDSDGNIWFGTNGSGLSKFDGIYWTTYDTSDGLAGNLVYTIAIDINRHKWFGTDGGVSTFDGTNWTTYDTSDGLANNNITAIAIDINGNKWFVPWLGNICEFDGTEWTNFGLSNLASIYVMDIAIDSDGNKWFACYTDRLANGGVTSFNGTNWTTYTVADGLPTTGIMNVDAGNEGNIWVGTDWAGAVKFDGISWAKYNISDGLADRGVRDIVTDMDGNVWFGGLEGGISRFDGTNWITYDTSDGLICNSISSIAVDSSNNKWFGTGSGVSMLVDTVITDIKKGKEHSQYSNSNLSINTSGKNLVLQYTNQAFGIVTFSLYNLHGRCIQQISEYKPAGKQTIQLNTGNVSNGSYIYRVKTADGNSVCQKITIML